MATTLSYTVVIIVMLITAYIIELSLCVRHCPELDMFYLIYLITIHMKNILPRTELLKFKSEYDFNYGKATQRKSSLKTGS